MSGVAPFRSARAAIEDWAAGFEPDLLSARFWGPTVLVSSVVTLLLLGATRLGPLRDFFGTRPAIPTALVVLRGACYLALLGFERRRGTSPLYFASGALGMGFVFQLVVSSLVVFSEPPGAFALAALPVLGAAYNCMILRATPRFPWPALGHGAAMALALSIRPESPRVEIFAVAGPLAVGGGLFLGSFAESMRHARDLLADHRRAIEASALEERTGEARRLSGTLLELLQRSHDASSALSTALLDAELLADLIRRADVKDPREIHAAVRSLRDALHRAAPLPEGHDGRGGEVSPGVADVLPAVRGALARVGRRFPAVRFEARAASRVSETARVALRGGNEELERLIAELAKNACEGSGGSGAATVRVTIDAESEPGAVAIRVADDGPGLPPHVRSGTPTAFVTTKPTGSGLGLYTAGRLIAASGGALAFENAQQGAIVTVRLPRC